MSGDVRVLTFAGCDGQDIEEGIGREPDVEAGLHPGLQLSDEFEVAGPDTLLRIGRAL